MTEAATKHLMLDLETLAISPGGVILEIGAVAFDPYGPLLEDVDINDACVLYRPVDIQSCLNLGMHVDAHTLTWWLTQTESNRQRIAAMAKTSIIASSDALRQFIEKHDISHVWSHGASFDIPIMEWVYNRVKKSIPWTHKMIRDTRTLFDVTDFTPEKWAELNKRAEAHHPLHDAWTQARIVQYCLNGDAENGDTEVTPTEDPAGARILAG